jgi:hypothetical protein
VGLEIEIEYDDSADAEWADERARPSRRRRAMPFAPSLRPGLVLGASVAVVGAAAVAGLAFGLTAPQDRSRVALHLASSESYLVDAQPVAAARGTDRGDRTVWLKVVNDGPRAVTVLGATLSSPDLAASRLVPDGGDDILKPGAVGTLRGLARFACGGGTHEGLDSTFAEVAFATVADVELRTADGRAHQVQIIVEQYNAQLSLDECGQAVAPRVVLLRGSGPGPRQS